MTSRRSPVFREPTDAQGDWHFARSIHFDHADGPTVVKFLIEKATGQWLQREPFDPAAPVLRYVGTSSAGGHPVTVQLELVAIGRGRHLYRLTRERRAPRCWEEEGRFVADSVRMFAHGCRDLHSVDDAEAWPCDPRPRLLQCVRDTVAAEDAATRAVEDPAPVAALQRQVLDALRAGRCFATASKEGGSQLFFDGGVFHRHDCGPDGEATSVMADDAAMVVCLRRFFDGDARQVHHPHPPSEQAVWQHIHAQLRLR